ncbi:Aste57867_17028 [Aphanomyces stellatus]|uniref:Aste57867_17028 protein n=1 Tax=Aphanomyces stellatus TaxID=120398 RepID=A0A485LA79_9STRA|nr:hypothetical protein As57867_016970 [Aphanomyces stellatus]VFT93789.1 Aste57867_17028 [Aphanomyces stellatus]
MQAPSSPPSAVPQLTTGDLDVDLLMIADKKLKRRTYNRDMMRVYAKERRQEKMILTMQAQQLEAALATVVARVRACGALGWRDIAIALADDQAVKESHNAKLRAQIQKNRARLRSLETWVAANVCGPQACPNPHVSTWRHVSLSSDPVTRLTGQRWITQRLFLQAEAIFHAFPPDAATSSFHDIEVAFDDEVDSGMYTAIQRAQFQLPWTGATPPSSALLFQWCHVHLQALLGLLPPGRSHPRLSTHPSETEVHGHTRMHRARASFGETINLVCGDYVDPVTSHRVVVAQQVLADDCVDTWSCQKNRRVWYSIGQHAKSRGEWTCRMVHWTPHAVTVAGGAVSIDDEARVWHVDLSGETVASKQAAFRRASVEIGASVMEQATAVVRAAAATEHAEDLAADAG